MVKIRKNVEGSSSNRTRENQNGRNTNLVRSHAKKEKYSPRGRVPTSSNVFLKAVIVLVLIILIFLSVQLLNYWHRSKLYRPFNAPSIVASTRNESEEMDRLWGTYRPHLYFGMRTRTPESLLFGLMWFAQYPRNGQLSIRYTCEQSDQLERYGWLYHDGRHFGSQEIVDDDVTLTTDFIKRPGGEHGGEWAVRVSGKPKMKNSRQVMSLMFLVNSEGGERLTRKVNGGRITEIHGSTKTLGNFKIMFPLPSKNVVFSSYLAIHNSFGHKLKDVVMNNLQYHLTGKSSMEERRVIGLSGDVGNKGGLPSNLLVAHVAFRLPFECDVVFMSGSIKEKRELLFGSVFTRLMEEYKKSFEEKFEKKFGLQEKGYKKPEIEFARASLSNMIGGIGYFFGSSQVRSRHYKQPVKYWNSALYTGVPSRSFFPRGFLWDEGFHQLLISHWDQTISLDIIAHWLDLMNAEGWIPREQILGAEARQKVPDEFVTQHNENANPPTLFLALDKILKYEEFHHGQVGPETKFYLEKFYPRLQQWFLWFNSSQTGPVPSSYRWRGRDAKTSRELNPKTLTSGLDDYPRASHPTEDERHVDLRCWMALGSGIMYKIGKIIVKDNEAYKQTNELLTDNNLLDHLHWCDKQKTYCDYGNHTKFASLERRSKEPGGPSFMIRVVRSKQGPTLKHVQAHGYISLFPFLLQIIDPSSKKLKLILDNLRKPALLWTPYGLRSLATTDPLYMKYNTEHDPPYWRGPIWINMNYLAIRSLRFYADSNSPYRDLAEEIYKELRSNVVGNILKQYLNSGYIWEQYNDKTGKGQGTFPFTGWSGLVTLIMGEIY